MAEINPEDREFLIGFLTEYIALMDEAWEATDAEEATAYHNQAGERYQLVVRILERLRPGAADDCSGANSRQMRHFAAQGRAELQLGERVDAALGPAGPSISASGLHPWVWHAAIDLWAGGYHRQAVQDAYTRVEELTRNKVDARDLSGKDLWAHAFNTEQPSATRARLRLDVDPADRQRWISAHEGARNFGMGCAQALRNWASHTLDNADEALALEYLTALSVLARWVEASAVEPARPE